MAIYPFIFARDKSLLGNEVFMRHERIHLQQQKELLWFGFFLWYGLEFLIKLLRYKNHDSAYRAISFEREAYENECDVDYIKNKKMWSFLKYL